MNGKKSFVINGKNADLFLVLAGTKILDRLGDKMDSVTAFLIESDMKGVNVTESESTLGCNGVQHCDVTFNNVELDQGIVLLHLVHSISHNPNTGSRADPFQYTSFVKSSVTFGRTRDFQSQLSINQS